MSSYIPRSLLDQYHAETADPSYRMSMLPFGTYPNADGSGEHFGLAMPGMVQEPVNALMRLMGTPSHPGTFTQGPDAGSNSEDMRTLLETFLGGNATRGMGEAASLGARALSDNLPSLPGAVVAGAERPGFDVWHGSPHDFDQFDMSKLGSGEGQQVYGHGLYFAESPSVAKAYQNIAATPSQYTVDGSVAPNQSAIYSLSSASPLGARSGLTVTPELLEQAKRIHAGRGGDPNDLADIQLGQKIGVQDPVPGYRYQAHVNADPNDFLDWGKPVEDQAPNLQNALSSLGQSSGAVKDIVPRDAASARAFAEAGIPGVRYDGDHYVLFSHDPVSVMHKWRGDQQLYSDQLPSLFGSVPQGQQKDRNSLFNF